MTFLRLVHFVPIITTIVGTIFAVELYRHWRRKPAATYLMWWFLGVFTYVAGITAESLKALLGWQAPIFRLWYIVGALLGAAPLAQGTVYLLLPRRVAHTLTVVLLTTLAIASTFVLMSPLDLTHSSILEGRLTGAVFEWKWVRRFSPFLDMYAAIFLIGGAIWRPSAIERSREPMLVSSATCTSRWAQCCRALAVPKHDTDTRKCCT